MTSDEVSSWQQAIKKDQQKDNVKKYGIWLIFGLIFLAGIGGLIMMAGTSPQGGTTTEITNVPAVSEKDIVLGDKNAPVTLIEYADMQCPACAAYNPLTNKLLEDD